MKKIILLIIVLFTCIRIFAQNDSIFRIGNNAKETIISINPEVLNKILLVEHFLNSNNKKISEIDSAQKNNLNYYVREMSVLNPYINLIESECKHSELTNSQIQTINENICIECYQKEWNIQQQKMKELINNYSTKRQQEDSVRYAKYNVKKDNLNSPSTNTPQSTNAENLNSDSSNDLYADKTNPYANLERSLNGLGYSSRNRSLTVFRNMDINFASVRFSLYLQDDFNFAYITTEEKKDYWIQKYKAKVSSGNEFINIKYSFQNRKDILGYYKTENNTYDIITSVEITGNKNSIIKLFLQYWPGKINFGGYKIGEIASKQLLGDYIVLVGVNQSISKILIKKGNMDVNYTTTYGINSLKK